MEWHGTGVCTIHKIQVLYLIDQQPRLLIFHPDRGRSQFERGYYSRAAFINDLTCVLIIYYHVMMSCELDIVVKTTS